MLFDIKRHLPFKPPKLETIVKPYAEREAKVVVIYSNRFDSKIVYHSIENIIWSRPKYIL